MLLHEVEELARQEGLTLLRAPDGSSTGFKGVSYNSTRKRPYYASCPVAPGKSSSRRDAGLSKRAQGGKAAQVKLGYFDTAHEAALAIARQLGPKDSAALAANARDHSGWLRSEKEAKRAKEAFAPVPTEEELRALAAQRNWQPATLKCRMYQARRTLATRQESIEAAIRHECSQTHQTAPICMARATQPIPEEHYLPPQKRKRQMESSDGSDGEDSVAGLEHDQARAGQICTNPVPRSRRVHSHTLKRRVVEWALELPEHDRIQPTAQAFPGVQPVCPHHRPKLSRSPLPSAHEQAADVDPRPDESRESLAPSLACRRRQARRPIAHATRCQRCPLPPPSSSRAGPSTQVDPEAR